MERTLSWLVAGTCAYEVLALGSRGKLPTLTALDRRMKHTLSPVLIGGLAAHFYVRWPAPTPQSLK